MNKEAEGSGIMPTFKEKMSEIRGDIERMGKELSIQKNIGIGFCHYEICELNSSSTTKSNFSFLIRQEYDGGKSTAFGLKDEKTQEIISKAPTPNDLMNCRGKASIEDGWSEAEIIYMLQDLQTENSKFRTISNLGELWSLKIPPGNDFVVCPVYIAPKKGRYSHGSHRVSAILFDEENNKEDEEDDIEKILEKEEKKREE